MSIFIPPSPSAAEYAKTDGAQDEAWFDAQAPLALFEDWLAQAGQSEPNDPNAMSLATVDASGQPDVRIVLLKGVSEAGFDFYTNSESMKGRQLAENPKAALCFHWKNDRRQVRVRGSIGPVGTAASDEYFASRARGSRLSAWTSDQSRPVANRAALITAMEETKARFEDQDVPRPEHWFGYRLVPSEIEFWQNGAFRLHDRFLFSKEKTGAWSKVRLYP